MEDLSFGPANAYIEGYVEWTQPSMHVIKLKAQLRESLEKIIRASPAASTMSRLEFYGSSANGLALISRSESNSLFDHPSESIP